jgi:glycosyltransferase involved in cell wall biosynthesis
MTTPAYYPVKGGTETVVRNLSTRLNQEGIPTDVMTFNMRRKWAAIWREERTVIDGVNVLRIPGLNWFPFAHSPRITMGVNLIPGRFANHLKNYDIVHFHEADFSFPLFSSLTRKPKILHLHGLDANFFKRYFLSRFILTHVADLYLSLTKCMKEELIDLGLDSDRIIVLPNGIDTEAFSPSKREKQSDLILFVGRISFDKGLHILLRSLALLEKPTHLVIIGPPDWNKTYFETVMRLIQDENKKGHHRVTYLGERDPSDLIKWYRKASMLVLPSLGEAFGMVNLEALSCGTPVVATNVGGVSEVVLNEKNGLTVPPGNPEKLADAIRYLQDNEKLGKRFGELGRARVIRNFSSDVILGKLRRIYEKLA